MTNYALIYVMCSSKEEAEKILLTLLEERLVACGNIYPTVTSYFHWEGKIDKSEETAMILKSKSTLYEEIEKRVCELHSYETPCVIKISADKMPKAYADWLETSTK